MIEALIRRARRRYVGNVPLAHAAYAASAAMGGVILLLIAGTQVLDWPFLLALSAGAVILGAYRTLRRVPSLYTVAQLIDQRLLLSDTLSTALFFIQPRAKVSVPMCDGQR